MASAARIAERLHEYWAQKKAKPIPAHVNFFYCFGGLSLFLIILQVLTGVAMLFFYEPDPAKAYQSIVVLSTEVPLGWLLRNLHRWSSTLLLAIPFMWAM